MDVSGPRASVPDRWGWLRPRLGEFALRPQEARGQSIRTGRRPTDSLHHRRERAESPKKACEVNQVSGVHCPWHFGGQGWSRCQLPCWNRLPFSQGISPSRDASPRQAEVRLCGEEQHDLEPESKTELAITNMPLRLDVLALYAVIYETSLLEETRRDLVGARGQPRVQPHPARVCPASRNL